MDFDLAHLILAEAIWLLVSLVGLYYGWANLSQSKHDRDLAEQIRNGLRAARIVVAAGYVFRNRIRVVIFAWWSLLGVMYGFFDPPDAPRIAGLLGLVVTAAGWSFIGLQESSERRELRAIIARQEHVDETGVAADTIKQRAALAAAQLEVVAQEAALHLRELARVDDTAMAADQRRSADAAERTADATEALQHTNEEDSA